MIPRGGVQLESQVLCILTKITTSKIKFYQYHYAHYITSSSVTSFTTILAFSSNITFNSHLCNIPQAILSPLRIANIIYSPTASCTVCARRTRAFADQRGKPSLRAVAPLAVLLGPIPAPREDIFNPHAPQCETKFLFLSTKI